MKKREEKMLYTIHFKKLTYRIKLITLRMEKKIINTRILARQIVEKERKIFETELSKANAEMERMVDMLSVVIEEIEEISNEHMELMITTLETFTYNEKVLDELYKTIKNYVNAQESE